MGINFAPRLSLGLAQQEALPTNSYLTNYFDSMAEYLAVGPPLYIVVKPGLNYSIVANQNLICSDPGCSKVPSSLFGAQNEDKRKDNDKRGKKRSS